MGKLVSIPLNFLQKINRCLARYSLCAKTTNQPTNRAPNEPERPLWAQESIFGEKFGRFGARNPNFYGGEQKFWFPHNEKPPRHLVRFFSVGDGNKWAKNANIWPKITTKAYFRSNLAFFRPKILISTEGSKSFGTHIRPKTPSHLV